MLLRTLFDEELSIATVLLEKPNLCRTNFWRHWRLRINFMITVSFGFPFFCHWPWHIESLGRKSLALGPKWLLTSLQIKQNWMEIIFTRITQHCNSNIITHFSKCVHDRLKHRCISTRRDNSLSNISTDRTCSVPRLLLILLCRSLCQQQLLEYEPKTYKRLQ